MFLQASVILSTGGVSKFSPTHPLPPDTVNERPVRILLECILVYIIFTELCQRRDDEKRLRRDLMIVGTDRATILSTFIANNL